MSDPRPAGRNAAGAASLVPILAVNFVGTLGFSVVLPFLVYLVTRLGGNALIYGVMGATYSLFQLIGAPILGRWSDRYGRRRILLLSQAGTAASWGLFLVALALPVTPMVRVDSAILGAFTITVPLAMLFLARALDGITGGNVSVANAYLADITTEKDRSANFGRMAVSGNLGFIVGPAFAGVLGASAWGDVAPVTGALAISLLACALIAFGLRESRPCDWQKIPPPGGVSRAMGQELKDCYGTRGAPARSIAEVLRLPGVGHLLALNFLVYLAFNFFYIGFPVYVARDLHWTLGATGLFFSVTSLLMVLVQGPVLARASRVWSPRTLVLGGCALLAVSFVFFTARGAPALYGGAALLALGNGLMWPSLLAILSQATPPDVQGAVQGLASSGGAVASIAGLLLGGLLYSVAGSGIFVIAAVITAATGALALRIKPRAP
jgi:MFS transporter, DHA1 family, tetracycline resistance protein